MKKRLSLAMAAIMLLASSCSSGSTGGSGTGTTPAPSVSGSTTASSSAAPSTSADDGKPDTWIADRHVVGQMFLESASMLPEDQINNSVAQKIKELTGMTIEWTYTTGNSNREVLVTSLASNDIPDVIASYLDHSGRPEFPILKQAALEGMFADLAPYMAESEIYSKYLDPNYLPYDTYHNIVRRDEFNDAVYLLHMQVSRDVGNNRRDTKSLYINYDIAREMGVEPKDLTTMDQVMELAQAIKDKGITNSQGNTVIPIGPSENGGRREAFYYHDINFSFNRDGHFNVVNGEVKHITGTDYMLLQVERMRDGLSKGLFDQEIFTMAKARAQEAITNGDYAMTVMTGNYAINQMESSGTNWMPINVADWQGNRYTYNLGKSRGIMWAVSSKAENPGEILQLADFLATREGKLIWMYGIEGETYDIDANGNPILKQEVYDLSSSDYAAGINLNIGALGSYWGRLLGNTDTDHFGDFGEYSYNEKLFPERVQKMDEILSYTGVEVKYVDGSPATAFISQMSDDIQTGLTQFMDASYFTEVFVQACFAESTDEAKKICDDYRKLLESQGIIEYEAFLTQTYNDNPNSIYFDFG